MPLWCPFGGAGARPFLWAAGLRVLRAEAEGALVELDRVTLSSEAVLRRSDLCSSDSEDVTSYRLE